MPFRVYTCKVCGKAGIVQYENELNVRFEWMISLIVHNRCGDYLQLKLRQRSVIASAVNYWTIKNQRELTQDEMDIVRSKAWEKLVIATKTYCFGVCRFYGKPPSWEPSIVEQILFTPDKWSTILNMFETAVSKRT